jgi:hypothetical protein
MSTMDHRDLQFALHRGFTLFPFLLQTRKVRYRAWGSKPRRLSKGVHPEV